MKESWTDRSSRVRKAARAQEIEDGAAALLLALLGEPTSAAVAVLRRLSVDTDVLGSKLKGLMEDNSAHRNIQSSIGDVERAAVLEATALQHPYIGTEHLLLAIIKSQQNAASDALAAMSVSYLHARAKTLGLLGDHVAEQKVWPEQKT